uniref:Uncharacterized protein n=1 Tax=Hyaloperonospora arabidopsidis (strain Emoy2) TaxID=559515 RepID=M4BTI9_HYAAE
MHDTNRDSRRPLATPSQSWNWLDLSQKSGECSSNKLTSNSRSNAVQNQDNTKPQSKLLTRAPTTTQSTPTPRTILTDREKPVETDTDAVEAFSKLRIADRTIAIDSLRQEMDGRTFIKLQHMDRVGKDSFTNGAVDWVTIGVLTRKTLSKPAANGSTFMVWGLSDLDGTELGIFLFGDAYNSHWKETTGSIVAVLNAALLPATEKNKFAFKVTQPAEVVKLGRAVDFGICKGTTSGEARCRLAVNTAKAQYCLHHIAANFMQAGRGRQQLNNATGSLRKTLFAGLAKTKNLSAGVYTSVSSKSGNSGWNTMSAKKRKRNDAADAVLSVPTVLAASGAVVQRIRKDPAHSTTGRGVRDKRPCGTISLMDQLREPAASMKFAPRRFNAGSVDAKQPSSRSQKILSAVIAKNGKHLRQPKLKKVDMIHFMRTGSQVRK